MIQDVRTPPYPHEVELRDGTLVSIRPITPEDAQREQEFVRRLSPESRYFRFMNTIRELSPEMLEGATHPDPARDIALVALTRDGPEPRQIGVARCVRADPQVDRAEFAIVVADEWQGKGLGSLLMLELIGAARSRGLRRLEGWVLATNHAMLELMRSLGFEIGSTPDDARTRHVVKTI
jgi:acetyltransferase